MPFNRLYIDGTLLAGKESFSMGIAFADSSGAGVSDPSTLSAWANAVLTLLGAGTGPAATVRGVMGTGTTIQKVRTYYYLAPGTDAAAQGVSSGAGVACAGGVIQAPQVSIVASLLTGRPGRRYRGRFYIPAIGAPLNTNGVLATSASPTTLSPAIAQLLRNIADAVAGIDLNPVVVSSVGGGAVTTVTSVSVGDVADTQRRRRDAMVENRVVTAVPA